jgi:hypothetical protein
VFNAAMGDGDAMAYAGGAKPLPANQATKQFVRINIGNILRNGVGEQLQCAFFAAPFNTAEGALGIDQGLNLHSMVMLGISL